MPCPKAAEVLAAVTSCADVPDAASPLAGKGRGAGSMSDAESSETADGLALVPCFVPLGYRRIVHPPSDDESTERT